MNLFNKEKIFSIDIAQYLELPAHVYLKDPQGTYLECNYSQAKSCGLSSGGEVIGKTDYDFLSEKEARSLQENDHVIYDTKKPKIIIEHAAYTDNQPCRPYLSYKLPMLNLTGKTVGIFGISIALDNNNLLSAMLNKPENFPLLSQKNILSKREQQCLDYSACGMTAKQVAKKLSLSPRTVEYYIEKMKVKFNCITKIELITKLKSSN